MGEKPSLAQIIDHGYLQQLQDRVSRTANISMLILDSEGNPVTKLSNGRGICKLIENYDATLCIDTRFELCRMSCEKRRTIALICPHTGMTEAGVPIFLGDYFLGVIAIGQIRFCGDDIVAFAESTHKTGIRKSTACKLLAIVPEFSRAEFDMIKDFISIVSDEIVKLAASSIELHEANERLKRISMELNNLAYYDQVLNIPNRERMEKDMNNDPGYECLIAIRIEDLDRLNNTFGRECGNALLHEMRDYLVSLNIPDSTLYRGQLSHFGILLKNIGRRMEVPIRIAEKIRERCKRAWEIVWADENRCVFIYANVCAIPIDPHRYSTFDNLIAAAGHALDIARKTDGVVVYSDAVRERFNTEIKLENSLKAAVRAGMRGFHVVYQPIISATSARWSGLEALCRWDSPELGAIPPGVFIPVAEANGLIADIGFWVLEQSIVQIKAWGLDLIDSFFLEVNISPAQLTNADLDRTVMQLLHKYNYPPRKLGLEVTESGEHSFSTISASAIERLSELGVVIILDDFGMGYSSFNLLQKLPVRLLKMDRTFISGIESDSHLRQMLKVMVSLAHGSDMKLIAGGIENNYQAEFLLKQGADFFQGYFFSHPLTATELKEKLRLFRGPQELTDERLVNNDYEVGKLRIMLDYFMNEIAAEGKIRESILDSMDIAIYISDLETNKILFANKNMQRLYGEPIVDRLCWEVLQHRNERCELCPVLYLLKNPGKSYTWEFYNEVLNKRFQVHDSIIPWSGGKFAHLECAIESDRKEV